MKVIYSPQLMEESAFRHLNHLERSGYRADYDEYHSLADPIYELPEDDREIAFEKVNKIFFLERLKLGEHVLRALEAVGLIPKRKRATRRAQLAAVASGPDDDSGETGESSSDEKETDSALSSDDEQEANLDDQSPPQSDTDQQLENSNEHF